MIIIKQTPDNNGAHANQSGNFNEIPNGYIAIPFELETQTQAILPWIILTVENGVVISVAENTTAKEAWNASPHPEQPPQPTPEETQNDMINMLVDYEYRLTILEV